MNGPLLAAGSLALVGAALHGGAGEVLVMRKLSQEALPPTRFGGARMTRTMIHTTWHLTTIAFVTVAAALLSSGSVLDGDTAHGVAVVSAAACTGFAVVALALGVAHARSPRTLWRHPGPAVLTASAALAWWGAL